MLISDRSWRDGVSWWFVGHMYTTPVSYDVTPLVPIDDMSLITRVRFVFYKYGPMLRKRSKFAWSD